MGLVGKAFDIDILEIRKVDKDTELAEKLIRFVEHFSWEDVKDHILQMLRTWAFTDWETVFVAIAGGQIVGMTTVMKTDYYPLPEIFPWVSSVFVSEDYRGFLFVKKVDIFRVYRGV